MTNLRFNYIPLPSTSSLELPQSATAATATPNSATQQRTPQPPLQNAGRERAGFFRRFRSMVARTPARPVDTQAARNEEGLEIQRAINPSRATLINDEIERVKKSEPMSTEEIAELRMVLENSFRTAHDEEIKRAVELSKESFQEEQGKRDDDALQIAIELSQASSPEMEDEMRRIIMKSPEMSPKEVRQLRQALVNSIKSDAVEQSPRFKENRKACIQAFNTLVEGNRDYIEFPGLSFLDVEDEKTQKQDTGMEVSGSDKMYSDMAPGVRLFRSWARDNDLKIVNTSAKNNNCMLDALMKIASGNYQGDFDERAMALKAELVDKYSDEVSHTNATLSADSARKSFKYALNSINKMFGTDMDVYVIQPSDTGLPVFDTGLPTTKYDEQDGATKKIPVILFNSGNHFEAVVAK